MMHDVVICGGGLAGQALARQLLRRRPDTSVAVIDPLVRPLPEAAFKVGESTVEVGAFYYANILGLADNLQERHVPKLGLRYFFGDATGPFHERPEFGLAEFPPVSSYQLDRGVLENDLRRLNDESGAVLLEGCAVEDIELGEGEAPHEVAYRRRGPDGSDAVERLRARWVVDASGRKRLLQRKLGLVEAGDYHCSAVWWRFRGRMDVEDLVPPHQSAWRNRVPGSHRYNSTTHLMGDGYWVWLIPLSSGCTSVGIVTDERVHPFGSYASSAKARRWLARYEPALAAYLAPHEPLDFLALRRYSHRTARVLSPQRWLCTGEAGFFSDPFYSPGSDLIGFGNTIATEVIARDRAGSLQTSDVETYNRWLISLNDMLTTNIQRAYPFFGKAMPMAAKLLWDFAAAWGYVAPQMFHATFLDRASSAPIREAMGKFFFLQSRMQRLFDEWGQRSRGAGSFAFFDYLAVRPLREFRQRNLTTGKSAAELVVDARANMEFYEELAQVLFLVAINDVLPEQIHRFADATWLNAWAVSLEPESLGRRSALRAADGRARPRPAPRGSLRTAGPSAPARRLVIGRRRRQRRHVCPGRGSSPRAAITFSMSSNTERM